MKNFIKLAFVFVVIFAVSPSFATHLGNVNLNPMRLIYSTDSDINQSAFGLYFDSANGDYYGRTINFNPETGDTEIEIYAKFMQTKVRPRVNVTLQKADGIRYIFSISNMPTAKQGITDIRLEGLYRVNHTITPVTKSLNIFDDPQPTEAIPLIDIENPLNWIPARRVIADPLFGWFNGEDNPKPGDIYPGESKNGFIIESPYLPGIRRISFQGSLSAREEERSGFPELDDVEENAVRRFVWADTNRFVQTKTIGPVKEPPADPAIVCDTFILDLISQVREAVTAGWIKHDLRKDRDDDDDHGKRKGDDKDDDEGEDNGDDDDEMDEADKNLPGIAKSIIKKLTKVRRECLRGKASTAREKLRALIKQVKAQRGEHLTDEAYYLIRFNAEFLLEKL